MTSSWPLGAIPLWNCLLELVIARTVPWRGVLFGLVLGLFLIVAPTLPGAP